MPEVVGRLVLVDVFVEAFFAGRAGRDAAVFFLELRARALTAFFFLDFFLAAVFEAAFFLVTFFLASLRFDDDLPALAAFFPPDFFFVVFFRAVFFPALFLLVAFFLETFFFDVAFFREAFLAGFFFETAFFLPVFLPEDRATARLREPALGVFFEPLFLATAFFFGMRSIPGTF